MDSMEIMKTIMMRQMFEPLMMKAMKRMSKYKKETMMKIKEQMEAEEKNPALHKEIMEEFMALWKACDANKDDVLDLGEFKVFSMKHNENNKRRWGESKMGSEEEVEEWYKCCNMFTPSKDGLSMPDFKCGMDVIRSIMTRRMFYKTFRPLLEGEMMKWGCYSKECQAKLKEAW